MKANKIGTIFLVSVLALAGIGISYAGWIDQITVTGTVQTGYVEFEVTKYSGTWVWKNIETHGKEVHYGIPIDYDGDSEVDDDPAGYYEYPEEWELIAYSYAHNSIPNEDIQFEFVNLYPCVNFDADFEFTIGTIPVILTLDPPLTWTDQTVDDEPLDWIDGIANHPAPTVEVTITYTDNAGVTHQVYPGSVPIQLHPGITYRWNLRIHIPQDNVYMNCYAKGFSKLDIIQWSDCEPPVNDKVITLPEGIYNVWFGYPGANTYFDAHLSGIPSNPYVWDGTWPCWCVDQTDHISPGTGYLVKLYSTYDAGSPYLDPDFPKVNWIINHKGDYPSATMTDFQQVIWYFVNGGHEPTTALGKQIRDDADSHGNFIPQTGQLIAVLLWPVDANGNPRSVQKTFIEVDP